MLDRWEESIPPEEVLGDRMDRLFRNFAEWSAKDAEGFRGLLMAAALGGGAGAVARLEVTLRITFMAGVVSGITGSLPTEDLVAEGG
jgi:hypothetical protein